MQWEVYTCPWIRPLAHQSTCQTRASLCSVDKIPSVTYGNYRDPPLAEVVPTFCWVSAARPDFVALYPAIIGLKWNFTGLRSINIPLVKSRRNISSIPACESPVTRDHPLRRRLAKYFTDKRGFEATCRLISLYKAEQK